MVYLEDVLSVLQTHQLVAAFLFSRLAGRLRRNDAIVFLHSSVWRMVPNIKEQNVYLAAPCICASRCWLAPGLLGVPRSSAGAFSRSRQKSPCSTWSSHLMHETQRKQRKNTFQIRRSFLLTGKPAAVRSRYLQTATSGRLSPGDASNSNDGHSWS